MGRWDVCQISYMGDDGLAQEMKVIGKSGSRVLLNMALIYR